MNAIIYKVAISALTFHLSSLRYYCGYPEKRALCLHKSQKLS